VRDIPLPAEGGEKRRKRKETTWHARTFMHSNMGGKGGRAKRGDSSVDRKGGGRKALNNIYPERYIQFRGKRRGVEGTVEDGYLFYAEMATVSVRGKVAGFQLLFWTIWGEGKRGVLPFPLAALPN